MRFQLDDGIVVVKAERVARLEERFDSVTAAMADLKVTVNELDARMQTGFSELRAEMSGGFSDVRSQLSEGRSESAAIRAEMQAQFRWIMGGIGTAALTILVAVLAGILARG